METLSLHNHIDSALDSSLHSHREPEFFHELPSMSIVKSNSLNNGNSDRSNANVQSHLEPKRDSKSQKKESHEEKIKSPMLSEILRPNSPRITPSDLSESFGMIDKESREREYFLRCMVLGSPNTGKHTLINSSLPSKDNLSKISSSDLLVKKQVILKTTKKYHFWIRSLGEASSTDEVIWQTYYKWATAFVFVYNVTNKESFKALEKAVQDVLRVVPREKFFGIIVGNKSDICQGEYVHHDEVEAFKQKYNISHFIETNSSIEGNASKLLPKLDTKLKLTFESI